VPGDAAVGVDVGFVGDVAGIDTELVHLLLSKAFVR
jgi:acetylglutamate kinase